VLLFCVRCKTAKWRTAPIKENIRVNDEIRAREVRLINQHNQQVGVVPLQDALRMAREAELDLVEVAPDAKPPVCKIVDYKKILYEQKRRARESRKKHKTIEIKEVKMRLSIDPHDYQIKIDHCREFLKAGNKVKISFMYRGRERAFQDRAQALLEQITKDLEDVALQESVSRANNLLTGAVFAHKK